MGASGVALCLAVIFSRHWGLGAGGWGSATRDRKLWPAMHLAKRGRDRALALPRGGGGAIAGRSAGGSDEFRTSPFGGWGAGRTSGDFIHCGARLRGRPE